MGIWFSSAQSNNEGDGLIKVPQNIAGITCSISEPDELMFYTSDSFFEVRTSKDSLATRILSMAPSCLCSTATDTFIIGFKTGFISEFDSDLNLITTFTFPGSSRAHNGEVIQVMSSSICHMMSIGNDRSMNFWNMKGLHISTMTTTGQFTSFCSSSLYIWVADTNQRMYVIDLASNSSKESFKTFNSFNIPDLIVSMVPFGEGKGCIASLKSGSIIIISTTGILSHLGFLNQPPVVSICPLRIDYRTGLISYVAVDVEGNLNLRVLEYIVKDLGKSSPFFTTNDTDLITIIDGEIVRYNKKKLEADSIKKLPEIELPRVKIVNFLNGEDEEEIADGGDEEENNEGDYDDVVIEEEDLPF
ncbi:hypothetical protein M9Y10_011713 [Tritrichomonas musculus]|uniref:Uncharacterized protein n=1 Tax=Tritrichomonas musculus TaxID=1915356 RepID=A0ABR2IK70_9EUKA